MSKGFAVGAALVPPCAARAGVVINLFDSTDGAIISSGPTNFSSTNSSNPNGVLSGDTSTLTGVPPPFGQYAFRPFSITSFPATQGFIVGDILTGPGDYAEGTVEWAAVEDYPASPELIGTFTVDQISSSGPFTAYFPIGSVSTIEVTLSSNPPPLGNGVCQGYEENKSLPPGSLCFGLNGGLVVLTPEPATLSILGAALGIFLMARRSVHRPTEGPPEDLAGA